MTSAGNKRRRLPPRQVCPSCRRQFRGYTLRDCPTCKGEAQTRAADTAAELRAARDARRSDEFTGAERRSPRGPQVGPARHGVPWAIGREPGVPPNEAPGAPLFDDGIPY